MKKVGKKTLESTRRGRPRSENPKNRRLPVRFTTAELAEIRSRSRRAGSSTADYVRALLSLEPSGYGGG